MRVTSLVSYPVKGAAGVSHEDVDVDARGLVGDRSFLVVDEDGVFRTQRGDPRLALVRPRLVGDLLTLAGPYDDAITLAVDRVGMARPVKLFHHHLTGIDQGADVAAWLTALLGRPSRLVGLPADHRRETDGRHPGTAGYADSGAVHVIGQESLDGLNDRLDAPLPMARFRPNIVVAGASAHAEDELWHAAAGGVELGFTKLAVRCAVTLVDQPTGRRAGPEPLRTLARYRRDPGGGVVFGAKFAVLAPGRIAVGDPLIEIRRTLSTAPAESTERSPRG